MRNAHRSIKFSSNKFQDCPKKPSLWSETCVDEFAISWSLAHGSKQEHTTTLINCAQCSTQSSYDQSIPTHPHRIKIKHSWEVLNNRSKKQPVHQRRQMKCLLVAITIVLRSLFSLSLSQYLCHGLLRCFLRSYITKLRDQLRLMSSFVQISNAWLAFDDGRSNAFLWLSF